MGSWGAAASGMIGNGCLQVRLDVLQDAGGQPPGGQVPISPGSACGVCPARRPPPLPHPITPLQWAAETLVEAHTSFSRPVRGRLLRARHGKRVEGTRVAWEGKKERCGKPSSSRNGTSDSTASSRCMQNANG